MINLIDLSPLMQRAVAKGVTFMISQSGIPNDYNLYFAKHTSHKGNASVRLSFDETRGEIIRCADEEHSAMRFDNITAALDYVISELCPPPTIE